ncbi:MAG: hypothetical protein MK041_01060 [Aquabacterium sp.]|nr:hypothetical protein [Aquabacterium sp.]
MNRSTLTCLLLAACMALPGVSSAATKKTRAAKPQATESQSLATPLAPASDEQIEAAKRAHVGRYLCEFGQEILLDRNDANPGYLNLKFKQQTWIMRPVLSSTGALRIEDTRGQAMLLQIAFKSMLLNTRTGQRIVDACVHEAQQAALDEAKLNPQNTPSLFGN